MSINKLFPLTYSLAIGLQKLGINLSAATQHKLIHYIELLDKWNQAYNLTAIRNPEQMLTKHILDSLSILPYLQGPRIADVGTGAGLPGIPLALACPHNEFVLLDSNGKKTRFLIQAKAELALTNVEVVQARVEAYKPQMLFNTITTRAFTHLNDMIMLTKHLCAPSAQLLAMKGLYPEDELGGIHATVKVYPLSVPGLGEQRHLVRVTGIERE